MISAILLAAGESKRMGRLKQLMPFGQVTIVERAIDNLLGTTVNEIIVVVGYKADEVIHAIGTKPVRLVLNQYYKQGMSTSIIAGLNTINSQARAVMLALADQPLINSMTVNRLLDGFRQHDKGIAVPTYHGVRGHPVIFAIKYKEELLGLKGDMGGRQIIEQHPHDIVEVAVDSEGVIADIDTMSDYHSFLD